MKDKTPFVFETENEEKLNIAMEANKSKTTDEVNERESEKERCNTPFIVLFCLK